MVLYRRQIKTILWCVCSLVVGLITGAWIATHHAHPSDKEAGEALKRAPCICVRQETASSVARSMGVPVIDAKNDSALAQYLSPTIYGHHPKVKLGSPATLRDEYTARHKILFGVMTQQNYLSARAKTLYDTWGSELPDQLVFYVGEDCLVPQELSHLPVIKLQGVSDQIYPPLRKAFVAMRHMCDNYLDKYHWFVRGDDDMYANGAKLQALLMNFDYNEIVVLGRPGVGADADMPRLRLLPHEAYCMGGPGMIFSRGAMKAIHPYLSVCYKAIVLHDNKTHGKWHDDDVEIGRCFSRFLDVQCSTSQQAMTVFHYDYFKEATNVNTLWSLSKFKEAITVHPIKLSENMLSLHHFYKRLEFEESYMRSVQLAAKVNKLCESLPASLRPPSYPTNCQLSVKSNLVEDTSLLYAKGELLEGLLHYQPQKEMPYFYNHKDRFDVSPWTALSPETVYEVGSVSSARSILPGLGTEMKRVIALVTQQHADSGLRLKEFVSGYTRHSPIGREYILNLLFVDSRSPPAQHYKRYHLLRPLSAEILSLEEDYFGPHPSVNVILPLVAEGDRVGEFLASFKAAILEASEKVSLRIVASSGGLEQAAIAGVSQHLGNPSNVFVKKVDGVDKTGAINAAMKELESGNDLVFITDVNTRIQPWFFHRCRSNTVPGKRVYFPIGFWTNELKTPPVYSSWTGSWGHTSFTQVCIYKSDYSKLEAFANTPNMVTLMEKVAQQNLEIMQAPETGLVQLFMQRTCNDLHRKKQHKCTGLKTLWSVDRPDLMDYLTELEEAKGMPLKYS